jgi:ketosteroid isomerase-like protein
MGFTHPGFWAFAKCGIHAAELRTRLPQKEAFAMPGTKQIQDLKDGWAALAAGDMDKLASYYAEDMIFVLPGQDDVLRGRGAFRSALDSIDQALPPGFEIRDLRYCPGDNEIVNIVEFTAKTLPNGSQCAVLFKFGADGLITEERWFVDTEQWKAAF